MLHEFGSKFNYDDIIGSACGKKESNDQSMFLELAINIVFKRLLYIAPF